MTNENLKFVFDTITNLLKPEYSMSVYSNYKKIPLAQINLNGPTKMEIDLKNELLEIDVKEDLVQIIGQNFVYSFDPKYIFYLKKQIDKLPKDKKK